MKKQVIVRAYGNEPLIRRVWSTASKIIYITTDANDDPIGFPREDVFKFDNELAVKMKRLNDSGKWDWSKLTPF